MKTALAVVLLFVFTVPVAAVDEWSDVAPGVHYRRYVEEGRDIHVTRVHLADEAIRVIASTQADRGLRVSEFAKKRKALVAINADYFDSQFKPIGLAVGACGRWAETTDTAREGVVAFGGKRARIDAQKKIMDPPEPWIEAAVSGWPMIAMGCEAFKASELPGSDAFTRAPHPRTAVGLTLDRKYLFLVVADGRKQGVSGLTLAELAEFMVEELDVCSAMNLDGGGSSAMWVRDRIVNSPSDGTERKVADHLAIILREDFEGCTEEIRSVQASQ